MMTVTVHSGHVEAMPVHFDDLDAMGIVHNARYAVMLERALSAYWSRHGFTFADGRPTRPDMFLAVAEYAISYKVPVRGTGTIQIHFWIERMGESSVVYAFRVLSADGSTVHAEGRRVNVKVDPRTLRPSPWTDEARAVAAPLMAG
jgi:acyl-CoA thioester hydrolase